MADQQFLASFGVDIDESGVSRLQKILAENRTLGDHLTAAFNAASESVKAFRESISEDFPTLFSGSGFGNVTESLFGDSAGLKIGLNMTEPKKEVAAFTADAKKPIPLTANASSIVSAARTAMEQVRSLFSETFILNVRANSNTDNRLSFQGSCPFSTEKEPLALSPGATNPPEPSSGNVYNAGSAFLKMSSGGRFSRPTSVQVAEDGDAEYIIPVKKENKALPLLRQLLSELSPSAKASLGNVGDSLGCRPFFAENEHTGSFSGRYEPIDPAKHVTSRTVPLFEDWGAFRSPPHTPFGRFIIDRGYDTEQSERIGAGDDQR